MIKDTHEATVALWKIANGRQLSRQEVKAIQDDLDRFYETDLKRDSDSNEPGCTFHDHLGTLCMRASRLADGSSKDVEEDKRVVNLLWHTLREQVLNAQAKRT